MTHSACVVSVVDHLPGITQKCRICKKVLKHGKFLIGLRVFQGANEFKYVLRPSSPEYCCGEEKDLFESFTTLSEALVKQDEISAHLEKFKTTGGLSLMRASDCKFFPG